MRILAADTSLPLLSVALLEDQVLLGCVALAGRGSRNEKLLPAVDWLLGEAAAGRSSIDLFAVTRGPGSFTGVRIGLATMQGLALALGRPLCAMSTHEAIALGEGDSMERVLIHDDAGRGEWYVSVFDDHRELVAPRLTTTQQCDELAQDAALSISVADFVQHGNVAAACARRAAQIAAAGELPAYADLTPIYVRLAEAEVKLQQKKTR